MGPRIKVASGATALLVAALLLRATLSEPHSMAHAPAVGASDATRAGASADGSIAGARDGTAAPEPLQREQVAPDASTAANEGTEDHRLRIVDEHSAPVPGAEYFEGPMPFASADGLLVWEAMREQWHPDVWLTSSCTKQVADAGGRVTDHTTDVPKLYFARHGGRVAFWGWPFPADLRLEPERTCKVTVVDVAGRPVVGAMVVLRGNGEVIVGVTDARGSCHAAHLQRLNGDREWNDARFGVRGLGLKSADVAFPAEAPPAEVTLTLPACGPISVQLLDVDGAPMSSSRPVVLCTADGEELAEYARSSGPVEFGLCACDLQLAVTNQDGHRIAGPNAAGERVAATLRSNELLPGGFVVTGVAMRADKTPLAECQLYARSNSGWYPDRGLATTTSRTGRFSFVFAKDSARDLLGSDGMTIAQCAEREQSRLVDVRGATIHLDGKLQSGFVDLGNVELQDAVIIARGRVRAGAGEKIEGSVTTSWRHPTTAVDVDAAGTFTVRALRDQHYLTLVVGADGYLQRELTTKLPCPDLDIVLTPGGELAVHVEVDPEVREYSKAVRIELVAADGSRISARSWEEQDGWHCTFVTAPGAYRCEVHTLFPTGTSATVPCTVAAADSKSAPLHIDLRGRLRAMHVRWVDPSGEDIGVSDAYVYAPVPPRPCKDGVGWDVIAANDCVLLGTGEPVSLVFEGPEHYGTWSGPFGDATVTVQPVPASHFRVTGLPAAPDGDEWMIRAIASAGDGTTRMILDDDERVRPNAFTFGHMAADGSGTLRLLPRTHYEIQLLFCPGKESTRSFRVIRAIPRELDVGVTPPDQLEFHFDQQRMQDAVR